MTDPKQIVRKAWIEGRCFPKKKWEQSVASQDSERLQAVLNAAHDLVKQCDKHDHADSIWSIYNSVERLQQSLDYLEHPELENRNGTG